MQAGCGGRITGDKMRVGIAPAMALRVSTQRGPQGWIGRRGFTQAFEQRPHIQACTADDQRKSMLAVLIFNGLDGITSIEAGIEWLIRLDQIDQPMRDFLSLIRRRVISPDIHPPAYLPRDRVQHVGLSRLRYILRE